MPSFKSISFKMAVLKGGGQNLPPHVCVIQKTPCGIGLITKELIFGFQILDLKDTSQPP